MKQMNYLNGFLLMVYDFKNIGWMLVNPYSYFDQVNLKNRMVGQTLASKGKGVKEEDNVDGNVDLVVKAKLKQIHLIQKLDSEKIQMHELEVEVEDVVHQIKDLTN